MTQPHQSDLSGPSDEVGPLDGTGPLDDGPGYVVDQRRRGFGASVLAGLKELGIIVGLALVLSFVVKTWLFQAFYIQSGSMENTLVKDDRVIVSKLTPGPFDLKRGDVVVFEDPGRWVDGPVPQRPEGPLQPVSDALSWIGLLPNDEGTYLIKRVLGLPGDTVSCCTSDGLLAVNGQPQHESYVYPGDAPSDIPFTVHVPQGRVWLMGDHRSVSVDSRSLLGAPGGGLIRQDRIVGTADRVVWPLDRARSLHG